MLPELGQHLDTLGLKPSATPDQAKQAYRDLVMVWHPDRFPADSRLQKLAQEKTKQINIAYQTLKCRLPVIEPQRDQAKPASSDAGETQHRKASGPSPNSGSQQERSRQSARANTTKSQSGRNTTTRGKVPISVGILFIFFGGV